MRHRRDQVSQVLRPYDKIDAFHHTLALLTASLGLAKKRERQKPGDAKVERKSIHRGNRPIEVRLREQRLNQLADKQLAEHFVNGARR